MTVTLDEDVAQRVDEVARASGQPLQAVVNDALRRELNAPQNSEAVNGKPYRVEARKMGGLLPGLSLDCIAELLDQVEGPNRR